MESRCDAKRLSYAQVLRIMDKERWVRRVYELPVVSNVMLPGHRC
jgi:hypothetical protein